MSEANSTRVSQLVRNHVPNVDDAIIDYVVGYLDETPSIQDEEDVISDFVKPMLIDAGGEEARVNKLCEELADLLVHHGREQLNKANTPAKLRQPINMRNRDAV